MASNDANLHLVLVLDADHALDFLSYLVLQACISFCSVSDKSGASQFLLCSHKNVVAHLLKSASWGKGASNGVLSTCKQGVSKQGVTWEESKGCLIKGCLNSTEIPQVGIIWRVPNPPGANPGVAERAFRAK